MRNIMRLGVSAKNPDRGIETLLTLPAAGISGSRQSEYPQRLERHQDRATRRGGSRTAPTYLHPCDRLTGCGKNGQSISNAVRGIRTCGVPVIVSDTPALRQNIPNALRDGRAPEIGFPRQKPDFVSIGSRWRAAPLDALRLPGHVCPPRFSSFSLSGFANLGKTGYHGLSHTQRRTQHGPIRVRTESQRLAGL